jgi:signal recognition particle subunit SRP54
MFDLLSDRLRQTLARLTGRGRISPADVDAAVRDIRLALLGADVNYRVVKDFTARLRERAVGQDILESLTAGQQIVKIVNEELTELLSRGDRTLHLTGSPAVVLLVGLQGSGKTTSAAKLGKYLARQGRRPLLAAVDPYRPAAAEQLAVLGKQAGLPVWRGDGTQPTGAQKTGAGKADVSASARQAIAAARADGRDVVVLDSAGRLTVDDALMAEIRDLAVAVKPSETLLVVDAMTGQEAVSVAEAFHAAVPVTGLVLTKIDGDARGGAALSISAVTGLPVKLMGTGEKIDALEPFHPDRLAGRILGMGDVLTLVERAQGAFDERQAREMTEKLARNAFTLEDFLDQLQQVKQMGPLGDLVGMIPGMGGLAKEAQASIERGDMTRIEAIVRSMTRAERNDPTVLNGSRRRRIASGSGTSLAEVNRLVKQFAEMQKLMRQFGGGKRLPVGLGRG